MQGEQETISRAGLGQGKRETISRAGLGQGERDKNNYYYKMFDCD